MSRFMNTLAGLMLVSGVAQAGNGEAGYTALPFGAIKPAGWVEQLMTRDMQGSIGHLDTLVPQLINDPIYSTERLSKHSKSKNLGNLKEGDMEGDDQYKWWNSETQSNWWDGYVRNALLLDNEEWKSNASTQVHAMLATQDADGYLGIYTPDTRYQFATENGELWAKATLWRYLLAYYEATTDPQVWQALVRAVDNLMEHYPIHTSNPFAVGKEFSGGVAHGLTITDVIDRMHQLTGNSRYQQYALFLYRNFSDNYSSEDDIQLAHVLDKQRPLQKHGVHTYEHLRALAIAHCASKEIAQSGALDIYLQKIDHASTVAGGAIGDEWVGGRTAHATSTGYEFCSLHELLHSYALVMQKRGDHALGDKIENLYMNASLGMRHPHQPAIAYLKTDNSYQMMGSRNGEQEAHRQIRYKYSPVHQDVAVCCVPNAGRITPYLLQAAWMQEAGEVLVAQLHVPSVLTTQVGGKPVTVANRSNYPYENSVVYEFEVEEPTPITLKVRKPHWATSVVSSLPYTEQQGYLVYSQTVVQGQQLSIEFGASVQVLQDAQGHHYFRYGALVYALPIEGRPTQGRVYAPGFADSYYEPVDLQKYIFVEQHQAQYAGGKVHARLRNATTGAIEPLVLVPMGGTILRQVAF